MRAERVHRTVGIWKKCDGCSNRQGRDPYGYLLESQVLSAIAKCVGMLKFLFVGSRSWPWLISAPWVFHL